MCTNVISSVIMTISIKKNRYIEPLIEKGGRRKDMLSILFAVCIIWFVCKLFIFGIKASWGILKLLCTVVFFPVILIGMVVGGLLYIAFPVLIIGGIIAFIVSKA